MIVSSLRNNRKIRLTSVTKKTCSAEGKVNFCKDKQHVNLATLAVTKKSKLIKRREIEDKVKWVVVKNARDVKELGFERL